MLSGFLPGAFFCRSILRKNAVILHGTSAKEIKTNKFAIDNFCP